MKNENQKIPGSILIVDDEPRNIQVLGIVLKKNHYDTEFATSGEEALEWANARVFDMVLMDVMMPGMDGFDTCRKLKSLPEYKDIPIIFLTAKRETRDVIKGFEAGAVDYITKPFISVELLARVKTHLQIKYDNDLLKKMALMDGLTQLFNHGYIHERLAAEISEAKRHGKPLSLIMLDLDHFKKVNDAWGHKVGDKVLTRVAKIIKEQMRVEDVAGRYGGEEFVGIFRNTNIEGASKVADRIRTAVLEADWEVPDLKVTISGGLCTLENETANDLITKADRLLYKAKENGRNRIEME